MTEPLLDIRDLHVTYPARRGLRTVRTPAIQGVTLHLHPAETLGLLGESGSGKSTIGNAVLGLTHPTAGHIRFRGQDITHATPQQRRALSPHIQTVFQDPYGSLNPARTIESTLAEPLRVNHRLSKTDAQARVHHALAQVGLPPQAALRYPSAFSGGQRQRIAIARALIQRPELIICDEPTSALDLSVQAQVLNLLLDLQQQHDLSYLFISHDIDVIHHMAHRTAVLHQGHIVEQGPTPDLIQAPHHPYTRQLLAHSAGRFLV